METSTLQPVRDIIDYNLKILFVGFNPGLRSAKTGHHFAGHSNRFWKLLFESRLTPVKLLPEQDEKLLSWGYGITNIVARPTKTAAELNKQEYELGRQLLSQKLLKYKPRIACYAGIGVYREFSGHKTVTCGLQIASVLPSMLDYVISSPSGLNRIPYEQQLHSFKLLYELAYA